MRDETSGGGFGGGDGSGNDPLKREHDAIVDLGRGLARLAEMHVETARVFGDNL
jgi:hypothetical protein